MRPKKRQAIRKVSKVSKNSVSALNNLKNNKENLALSQSVSVLNGMSTKHSAESSKRNKSDDNSFHDRIINNVDDDIPQLYEDMKFPLHNYVMLSSSETLNRSTLKQEMSINNCYYKDGEELLPIPFVFAQPEGMPCWIKGLDDIVNMSEGDVKVFLRGYDKSLEGTLDELKRNLAVTVGVPIDDADKRFNYKGPPGLPPDYYHNMKTNRNASVAKTMVNNVDDDIPQLYEDMKFPLHNYVMLSSSETLNRSTLKQEMSINNCYYKDGEELLPIPFVFAQPEGMPCWIKGLDDVVNMSEGDVKVFLRGYDKSLEGTLDELKRNLAVTVGVPIDDADKRFNYKGPPGLPPDYYHNMKTNRNASQKKKY